MLRPYATLCSILSTVLFSLGGLASNGAEIDFSGLPLTPGSYWNGSDGAGGFSTSGVFFNNSYTYYPDWEMESWAGWSYSNVTDTAGGFGNQYAAATGGGVGGAGSAYSIGFVEAPNETYLDLGVHRALALKVSNTAYTYRSMLDGDAFAKKFAAGDWFRLRITGFSGFGASGSETGSIDFLLASGTTILSEWASIDLTSLPAGTRSLGFDLTSSDNGDYGMNTPAYFALGSLTVAPEPGTAVLVTIAGLTFTVISFRRRC